MSRRVLFAVFALLLVLITLTACSRTASTESTYSLGLKLATADQLRNVPVASVPYSGQQLPSSADLSRDMPPPGQQGKQNSCVGWAVAYALKSYQERIEEGQALVDVYGQPDPNRVFSPAFIYNQINNSRDGGSYISDALNLLKSQGAATWADMPYRADDYQQPPSETAKARAQRYRIEDWRQINAHEVVAIKAQLNAGYPVIVGVTVDQGFVNAKPGFIRMAQVVIHFYFDAGGGQKGAPVRSLLSEFSTIYGDAATGTPQYSITPSGLRMNWVAWIPYQALNVPSGGYVETPEGAVYQPAITALIAEPTLFVDNFGIRSGGLFPFTVQY